MAKLGNFFVGKSITLTQSPHGSLQDNKSVDVVGSRGNLTLYAPFNGIAERVYGSGEQKGFHFIGKGWDILFHHASPIRLGAFKKGDKLGSSTWHHIHTAIRINGRWEIILEYMDRDIKINLSPSFTSLKWKSWKTWGNKELPYTTSSKTIKKEKMDKLIKSKNKKISKLEREIQKLKKENKDVLNKYKNVAKLESEKSTIIKQCESKALQLEQDINRVQTLCETYERDNVQLKADLETLKTRNNELERRVRSLTAQLGADNLFIKISKWIKSRQS